jgi:hypothetical protein
MSKTGNNWFKKIGNTLRSKIALDIDIRNKKLKDVASTQYNITNVNPIYNEGETFYDNTKKALSYYNDSSDVTINLGQEVLFIVENQTGELLANGTVISPDKSTIITKANAYVKEKSRIIAVLTEDIADGETGYATKLGQVGGLDTSMFSVGQVVYLGNNGDLVADTPIDGGYICIVGVVDVVDADEGIITVDTKTNDLTVEVTDTNGFPPDQRDSTQLAFVDSTRLFTILPKAPATGYYYYQTGNKYEKIGGEAITITDVEGLHVIYYDGDTLTAIANPNDGQIDTLIRTKCLVSYIYWDAANSEHSYFADERHGISISPNTHAYLHFVFGAKYLSGLAISNLDTGGGTNTSDDIYCQFGIGSGITVDEDLITSSSTIGSTTGLPIFYLDGANGDLRMATKSGFSMLTDNDTGVGTTGRLVYNENTGSTWQTTTVTANDYVLCHVFQINGYTGTPQQVSVIGQNEYANVTAARAGASTEISNIILGFPFQEVVPVATIIFQTRDGITNGLKARTQNTASGESYVDWRVTELSQGTPASSHNNLADLELAQSNVTWGHINNLDQQIAGAKRFDQIYTQVQNITPVGTSQSIDWNNGSLVILDMSLVTGTLSLTLNNGFAGASYVIEVNQETVAYDIQFPAGTKTTEGGNSITGIGGATQVLSMYYNGTNYVVTNIEVS